MASGQKSFTPKLIQTLRTKWNLFAKITMVIVSVALILFSIVFIGILFSKSEAITNYAASFAGADNSKNFALIIMLSPAVLTAVGFYFAYIFGEALSSGKVNLENLTIAFDSYDLIYENVKTQSDKSGYKEDEQIKLSNSSSLNLFHSIDTNSSGDRIHIALIHTDELTEEILSQAEMAINSSILQYKTSLYRGNVLKIFCVEKNSEFLESFRNTDATIDSFFYKTSVCVCFENMHTTTPIVKSVSAGPYVRNYFINKLLLNAQTA